MEISLCSHWGYIYQQLLLSPFSYRQQGGLKIYQRVMLLSLYFWNCQSKTTNETCRIIGSDTFLFAARLLICSVWFLPPLGWGQKAPLPVPVQCGTVAKKNQKKNQTRFVTCLCWGGGGGWGVGGSGMWQMLSSRQTNREWPPLVEPKLSRWARRCSRGLRSAALRRSDSWSSACKVT